MILVRVDSRSTTSAGAIRRTFARLFPSGVLKGPMWLDDYTSVALFPVRLGASVLSALGGLAMGLAALGLYAIMAFRVAQRTREVGVRIAIGASRVRIIGMFILQGAKTAATGLLVGLPLGLAVQKVFKAMIPAVRPRGSRRLRMGRGVPLVRHTVGVGAGSPTGVPHLARRRPQGRVR